MKRVAQIATALAVAIAISAVAASAASAVEGPYWDTGTAAPGARLLSGLDVEVFAKQLTNFVLGAGTVTVTCTAQKLKAGSVILGSTGANAGKSDETIEFSGCSVTGAGTGCTQVNSPGAAVGTIVTNPVSNLLVYESSTRAAKTKLGVLFVPAEGEVFVELQLNQAPCEPKTTKVTGKACGEALSGGAAVLVGEEPAISAAGNELKFPWVTKVFDETEKVLKEEVCSLKAFAAPATLTGTTEVTLENALLFGILTT